MTDSVSRAGAEAAGEPAPVGVGAPLLTYVVGRLDRIIRTRLGEILGPLELTVAQFTMLSVLARRPGLSNAQLARRALILPQSTLQVLSALESRKLVVRTPARGRVLTAQLTPAGRALLVVAETATRALEAEMLDGDAHEAAGLMRTMTRWSEALTRPRPAGRG